MKELKKMNCGINWRVIDSYLMVIRNLIRDDQIMTMKKRTYNGT